MGGRTIVVMPALMESTKKWWIVGSLIGLLMVAGVAVQAMSGKGADDDAARGAPAPKDESALVRRVVKQALNAYYGERCSKFRELATERVSGDEQCAAHMEFLDGAPVRYIVSLREPTIEGDSAIVRGRLTIKFDGDVNKYKKEYRALKVDGEWKYDGIVSD